MSRTRKSTKAPGYEYWSRRPGSNGGGCSPGAASKRHTHRAERQQAQRETRIALTTFQDVAASPSPPKERLPMATKLATALLVSTSLAVAACGEFRARPDLRQSTMTVPGDAHCVRGHKAITSGGLGVGGAPVTVVQTDQPCVVPPPSGGSP
jgi:hypothetical protein